MTVIATETYEQFTENLQKEYEAETGIRFGIVEQHQFAAIAVTGADGQVSPLGVDQSKALWEYLKAAGHINAKGKVQDSLGFHAGTPENVVGVALFGHDKSSYAAILKSPLAACRPE